MDPSAPGLPEVGALARNLGLCRTENERFTLLFFLAEALLYPPPCDGRNDLVSIDATVV